MITTQPAVTPSSGAVGTVFTLTEPIALNSVITLTNFTLSGVDKTSELVGLTWGSSGENAGDIAAAFTVENSGGLIVAQADATLTGAASNSLNIIASRTSVLGEQAINFEPDLASLGSLVGADPRKDILWNWDFGEVGASYLYHDPSMPWANNPNHKQGPRVAHSFTTYGSGVTQFTVTLTGRDAAGNVETGQILIDVENPDDHVYSKVYAVSFASNFTGAPAGATQLTNEADFRSAIFAEDGNSDVRFIFRSGETYTFTVAQSRRIGFSGCFGGVYGGTAPAILTTNMGNPGSGAWTRNDLFLIGGNAGDLLIKDLDFQGAYDPLTGTCSDALIQMFSCYNNITEITFHRIKAVGVHMLCVWNTDSGRVSFSDTYCSDFYDYAVFFNQPNSTNGVLNMYGGYWSQDPAVGPIFTGDGTNKFTNPDFPNQGPLRMGNGKTLCVNDMWFGSFNGWTASGSHQPNLRLYRTTQSYEHEWYINRVWFNNTGPQANRQNSASGISVGGLIIFDKCVWRGLYIQPNQRPLISLHGGVTIRNTIWFDKAGNGLSTFVRFDNETGVGATIDPTILSRPVEIYSNSFITEGSGLTFDPIIVEAGFTDVNIANNYGYAPNSTNAGSWADASEIDTEANLFKPLPGSGLIDGATGLAAIDDFDGTLRGSTKWVGPFDEADGAVSGLGLVGPHDFYIDAVIGDDANDGMSEGSAWASLNKLTEALLEDSTVKRVLVKPGLYDKATDYIKINNAATTGAELEIAFAPGVTIDGSNYAGNESAFDPQGSAFTLRAYGNGATIRNVTTTTGNALGGAGSVVCHYHNFTADGCLDGMTMHNSAVGHFYDITVLNAGKSGIAHVNSSTAYHYRCHVTEKPGGGTANAVICDAGSMYFEDCVLVPDANGGTIDLDNATLLRCQIGEVSKAAKLVATAGAATLSKCFVNVYVDGNSDATFDKCFGLFSARSRNGGSITTMNCVFAGAASNQSSSLFSKYNPGSSSAFAIRDTIFAGSYTHSNVDAANAGYIVAAGSELHHNSLTDGKTYDADLIAADSAGSVIQGTLTSDPLIGAANSLVMADYAFGAGSPAIGAGRGGGDIGFGAGEVEERNPQVTY